MKQKKRGRLESFVLFLATIVAVGAALILFFVYTGTGKRLTSKVVAGYLHGAVKYVAGDEKTTENKPKESEHLSKIPADGEIEDKTDTGKEKECYHLLLLGEEALKGVPGKGRTDAIILASVHVTQKKVVLTSILRDTYAEPEGIQPCKINAVYAKQGVQGLYRILYDKLGVWPDGYLKVGFDSFEEIIDMLGGAEVTLTQEEAEYLNTHDYISKKEFRNVTAGTHVLNGNQVLGYCRVRYVPNYKGTKHDFGRTERQRMVIKNLFERYKEAGLTKWVKIAKDALGYIETDISEATLEELIYVAYDGKITTIEQRQLPAKGTYESADKGKVTSTLVVDWEKNKDLFWEKLK